MLKIHLEEKEYNLLELEEIIREKLFRSVEKFTEVEFICTLKTFDYIEQEAIKFKKPSNDKVSDLKLKKIMFIGGVTGIFNIL